MAKSKKYYEPSKCNLSLFEIILRLETDSPDAGSWNLSPSLCCIKDCSRERILFMSGYLDILVLISAFKKERRKYTEINCFGLNMHLQLSENMLMVRQVRFLKVSQLIS